MNLSYFGDNGKQKYKMSEKRSAALNLGKQIRSGSRKHAYFIYFLAIECCSNKS